MIQEEQAFVEIIRKNEGIIYKITRLYARDEEMQKDLFQEIVYQLWKGYPAFRGEAKVSTWMYRIALNTALFQLKISKKGGNKVSMDGLILEQDHYDPVFDERLQVLYASIRKLGDVDKGIVFLFLEGKKYEDIAGITGLSLTNVSTRMARIREKLKRTIINS